MIRLAEIDSIPVVYTEDGPSTAGLVFRVGSADEVLSQRGLTHLIEHLALHRLGATDYHFNGTTGPYFTSFFTRGDQARVVTFLEQVAASLGDLPIDRLDIEKGVLRTEEDGRATSVGALMALWRYGAVGLGAASYNELGRAGLRPYDLTRWVSRYFTRENAVLWFSGMTPPSQLRLALASGVREPIVESVSILPTMPAFRPEFPQHLGLHAEVGRTTRATVFSAVWQRELFRRLRQENGYCYTPTVEYSVIDANRAQIFAAADLAPDLREAALGEFVDTFASLRWGESNPSLLKEVQTSFRSAMSEPGAEASRLPQAATDLLIGRPPTPTEALKEELDAVTPADLYSVAAEVASSALLFTPQGLGAAWAGFARVPETSEQAVTGRPFVPINDPSYTLVIGVDGVSLVTEAGPMTVLYGDCQAMLVRPDGARTLIARDGVVCPIEPTLFTLPEGILDTIDQQVPPDRVVRMPPRPPEQIPMPPQGEPGPQPEVVDPSEYGAVPMPPQQQGRDIGIGGRVVVIIAIVILGLGSAFAVLVAVVASLPAPDSDPNVSWVFWVFAAIGGFAMLGLSSLFRRR